MTQPTFTYRVRTRPVPSAANVPSPATLPSRPDDDIMAAAMQSAEAVESQAEVPISASAYRRSPEKPASTGVGYKRPPVAHQFKPGQRANPHGRPKGSKNVSTLAREQFYAKVKVREGGRTKQMWKGQIGITKLMNRFAETGDPKILLAIVKLLEPSLDTRSEADPQPRPAEVEIMSPTNKSILDWFLARNMPAPGHDTSQPGDSALDPEELKP